MDAHNHCPPPISQGTHSAVSRARDLNFEGALAFFAFQNEFDTGCE